MACAIHGPASLCGPDCSGFIHSDVPDAPPPAPPARDEDIAADVDFEEMPEGAAYPEGESVERVGENERKELSELRRAVVEQGRLIDAMSATVTQLYQVVADVELRVGALSANASKPDASKPDNGNARTH